MYRLVWSTRSIARDVKLSSQHQVIEVAPTHCVIELSTTSGKLGEYGKVPIESISYVGIITAFVNSAHSNIGPLFGTTVLPEVIEPAYRKLGRLDANGCLQPPEEKQQLHWWSQMVNVKYLIDGYFRSKIWLELISDLTIKLWLMIVCSPVEEPRSESKDLRGYSSS